MLFNNYSIFYDVRIQWFLEENPVCWSVVKNKKKPKNKENTKQKNYTEVKVKHAIKAVENGAPVKKVQQFIVFQLQHYYQKNYYYQIILLLLSDYYRNILLSEKLKTPLQTKNLEPLLYYPPR